nr:hypothetical protein [Tanacetum cinerariifolium]
MDNVVKPLWSCLKKVSNIDGKVLGKDGKPIKAFRGVQFSVVASSKAVNKDASIIAKDTSTVRVENMNSNDDNSVNGEQVNCVDNPNFNTASMEDPNDYVEATVGRDGFSKVNGYRKDYATYKDHTEQVYANHDVHELMSFAAMLKDQSLKKRVNLNDQEGNGTIEFGYVKQMMDENKNIHDTSDESV